ncbi:DUF7388 family protein [Halobacterium bonnevillei]|uniref:Alpha/beta fold hydrolase n=1 Tax=Halobacterium bonnevillei TaxID=2692200 RepID=A0A6B0SCH7_9EURY|nr:alpha/beta fold hydrolase [Halobacterium bonnevillei]MXR19435.1 alpha/beta fold hydrolase [Halobacterium bonnevillei]
MLKSDSHAAVAGVDAVALKPSEHDLECIPDLEDAVETVVVDYEGREHLPEFDALTALAGDRTVRVTAPVRADGFDPLGDDSLADAIPPELGRVFVAGHSQGGMAAPRIADRHGGVAGIVSIDGPADPGMDADDLGFLRYSIEPDGDLTEEQEAELEAKRETFRRVADGDYDLDEEILGKPGRWHDSVDEVTTAETAAELDAAVFVAKAGRADPETQPEIAEMHEQHYEEWCEHDLGEDSTVEFYEDVDHYMQEGYDPSGMAALYFPGNAAEYVVTDVAEWVHDVADD